MRKAFLACLVIWPFLLSGISFADPGAGLWTSCQRSTVSTSTGVCRYTFTTAVDSGLFYVNGPEGATLQFDPDAATIGAATGQIKVWRVSGITQTDETASIVENATLTGAAGFTFIYELPAGTYWIEVSTSPGGDTALVEVTIN